MFKLEEIIRPNVKSLKPYASARDEFKGTEGIFLDANENPHGSAAGERLNRYPDPLQWALKEKIAAWKEIHVKRIFLGNGSDEIIDLLMRAFCEPGQHNVVITPPTYGVYQVYAGINNVAVKKVFLDERFKLSGKEVLNNVDAETRLIFLCSPNNPTGNTVPAATIRDIARNFDGLVVVDEAYADFSEVPSSLSYLEEHANLFVIQTFSKAWGMAALRLGMGFATEEIVSVLNKIKPPYNINAVTQQLAIGALERKTQTAAWVQEIIRERIRLAGSLEQHNAITVVYPSEANFLLVKTTHAEAMYNFLTERGIIVRNRSSEPGCGGCLRITVGSKEENDRLLEALKQYT